VAAKRIKRARSNPRNALRPARRTFASAKSLASGAVLTGAVDWVVQRAFRRRASLLTSVLLSVITALVAAKLGRIATRR
jgi:hypothetical protein